MDISITPGERTFAVPGFRSECRDIPMPRSAVVPRTKASPESRAIQLLLLLPGLFYTATPCLSTPAPLGHRGSKVDWNGEWRPSLLCCKFWSGVRVYEELPYQAIKVSGN